MRIVVLLYLVPDGHLSYIFIGVNPVVVGSNPTLVSSLFNPKIKKINAQTLTIISVVLIG